MEELQAVKPDKNSIREWLKRRKLRDVSLVRESGLRYLESAFPSHTRILKTVAENQNSRSPTNS